jgi:hypothetical protein
MKELNKYTDKEIKTALFSSDLGDKMLCAALWDDKEGKKRILKVMTK